MRQCWRGWDDFVLNVTLPSCDHFDQPASCFIVSVFSQWSYVCLRFWVLQQASTFEQRKRAAERWKTEQRDSRWVVGRPPFKDLKRPSSSNCTFEALLLFRPTFSLPLTISRSSVFCLQNQWRISHLTATSRARERVGEGIPRKLLYL